MRSIDDQKSAYIEQQFHQHFILTTSCCFHCLSQHRLVDPFVTFTTFAAPGYTMTDQQIATDPNYKPPPGRLGNLTPQQQEALDKLRAEVQQEGWFVSERMNDAMLLRCVLVVQIGG